MQRAGATCRQGVRAQRRTDGCKQGHGAAIGWRGGTSPSSPPLAIILPAFFALSLFLSLSLSFSYSIVCATWT